MSDQLEEYIRLGCQEDLGDVAGVLAEEIVRLRGLIEGLPEFQCPACGATTRARMADHPKPDPLDSDNVGG